MNYIINPSWFYWINVADTAKLVLTVLFCCLLVACIFLWPISLADWVGDEDDKRKRKMCTVFSALAVVTGLAAMFIPSRNTLIEMQIAKYATYENAEWTVDAIKNVVDYIVNAIQSMK